MTEKEIENNFTYHAPSTDMPQKFQTLRDKAKELAFLINKLVPSGREQSLAQTKLQEVIMWANAGIVIPKEKDNKIVEAEIPDFIELLITPLEISQQEISNIIKAHELRGYEFLGLIRKQENTSMEYLRFRRKNGEYKNK